MKRHHEATTVERFHPDQISAKTHDGETNGQTHSGETKVVWGSAKKTFYRRGFLDICRDGRTFNPASETRDGETF